LVIVLVAWTVLLPGYIAWLLLSVVIWPCAVLLPAVILTSILAARLRFHWRSWRTGAPPIGELRIPHWAMAALCAWGIAAIALVASWLVYQGRAESTRFADTISQPRGKRTAAPN